MTTINAPNTIVAPRMILTGTDDFRQLLQSKVEQDRCVVSKAQIPADKLGYSMYLICVIYRPCCNRDVK
ncbi:hypothetical protein [Candidatus Tisiphia endosymbiont of Thecophora atra]|uniref:hypothetical protein n=1 Tax=Candidatus Tisiphia endosymbiont of Thecophora atra TaxID=3066258 RepID=UPI00312C8E10